VVSADSALPTVVFGVTWVHVFEEDTAEVDVYRPESDDIPLSRRPRERLELFHDGSATLWMPGAGDRPEASPASWKQEGGAILLRSGKPGARVQRSKQIISATATRLTIAR
jgi:hypothetical protein